MSFFKLSKYIGISLIAEWMQLKEFLLLSIAMTENQQKTLMGWLSEYSELFSKKLLGTDRSMHLSCELLNWLGPRFCNSHAKLYLKSETFTSLKINKLEAKLPVRRLQLHGHVKFANLSEDCTVFEHVEELIVTIKQLQSLEVLSFMKNLRSCNFDYDYIKDDHIMHLCRCCPELRALRLNSVYQLNRRALQCLVIHARKLTSFDFGAVTIEATTGYSIFSLHFKAPLTTLIWTSSRIFNSSDMYFFGTSRLTTLYLSSFHNISSFSEFCPYLMSLDVYFWTYIGSQSVVLSGLYHLIHFSGAFSNKGQEECIVQVVTQAPKLQTMRLKDFGVISHATIQRVVELTDLTSLAMTRSGLVDDDLVLIAESCPQLTHLDVSSNALLTDISFIVLANNCRKLEKLKLRSAFVTDVGLTAISLYCKRLWYIDIGLCTKVTDLGIFELLTWLPLKEMRTFELSLGSEAKSATDALLKQTMHDDAIMYDYTLNL